MPTSETARPSPRTPSKTTHNNMVAPALLNHIRHQLRRNRRAALILLILPRIREQGEHGRDAPRARDLARMHEDAQLHQRRVHARRARAAARVHDVHVVVPHALHDPHGRLPDRAPRHVRPAQRDPDPGAGVSGRARAGGGRGRAVPSGYDLRELGVARPCARNGSAGGRRGDERGGVRTGEQFDSAGVHHRAPMSIDRAGVAAGESGRKRGGN